VKGQQGDSKKSKDVGERKVCMLTIPSPFFQLHLITLPGKNLCLSICQLILKWTKLWAILTCTWQYS